MVISVQDFLEVALNNATLGAQLLNHRLTAADQTSLTRLQRLSAVSETSVRVTGEVCSTLSDLLSDVMAWMSNRRRREEERRCESDEGGWKVDHLGEYLEASGSMMVSLNQGQTDNLYAFSCL